MKVMLWAALPAMLAISSPALAADAVRSQAGALADGTPVEAVTLKNDRGIEARIITYGATLQSLIAPDRDGKRAEVTLGYDDVAAYESKPNFFGVTVGRYANRIAKARFSLDGRTYELTKSDGENSLHGGTKGFDKQNWRILSVSSGARIRAASSGGQPRSISCFKRSSLPAIRPKASRRPGRTCWPSKSCSNERQRRSSRGDASPSRTRYGGSNRLGKPGYAVWE